MINYFLFVCRNYIFNLFIYQELSLIIKDVFGLESGIDSLVTLLRSAFRWRDEDSTDVSADCVLDCIPCRCPLFNQGEISRGIDLTHIPY